MEKAFHQEFEEKQTVLIKSMSKQELKEFGSYTDSSTSLVSELECVGGNCMKPLIQSFFMSNISEKYNSKKIHV